MEFFYFFSNGLLFKYCGGEEGDIVEEGNKCKMCCLKKLSVNPIMRCGVGILTVESFMRKLRANLTGSKPFTTCQWNLYNASNYILKQQYLFRLQLSPYNKIIPIIQ